MKQITFIIVGISLLVALAVQPMQAGSGQSLESRINGWFSAVNEGNYHSCLSYVAPPRITGQRGLTRMRISGGGELLLFFGEKLLPLREYQIKRTELFDNGNEARVTIDAEVIHSRKPLYTNKNGVTGESDMIVYPATITQRWIFLNGAWFIKSMIRLQYLGS